MTILGELLSRGSSLGTAYTADEIEAAPLAAIVEVKVLLALLRQMICVILLLALRLNRSIDVFSIFVDLGGNGIGHRSNGPFGVHIGDHLCNSNCSINTRCNWCAILAASHV